MGRILAGLGAVVALSGALAVSPAPAASGGRDFAAAAQVREASVSCLTRAPRRNRVVLDARVRYGDVPANRAAAFARHRHVVRAKVELVTVGGRRLARVSDAGRAQVAIRELTGYVHLHRVVLPRAASRRVLAHAQRATRCRRAVARPRTVFVRIGAVQRLVAPRSPARAAGGPRQRSAAQPSAASPAQRDRLAAPAHVTARAAVGDVVNGCEITEGTNCEGADLSHVDLSGADVSDESDFTSATFVGSTLRGTRFQADLLGSTTWNDADLTGANHSASMLLQADFSAQSRPVTSMNGANLSNSDANFANFTGADLSGAELIGMGSYFATFSNTRCDGNTQFVTPPLNCVNGLLVSQ
jgi:Pentapeptide repeats (8 copies)